QCWIPCAMQVVALNVAEIEIVKQLRIVPPSHFDVRDVRGQERRELVVLARRGRQCIELRAELVNQSLEVRSVVLDIDDVFLVAVQRSCPLPVEVESTEDPRRSA